MSKEKLLVTNVKSLSKSLMQVYNELHMGNMPIQTAKELANVSGKIVKANLGRLEYKAMTKHDKLIDFWEE